MKIRVVLICGLLIFGSSFGMEIDKPKKSMSFVDPKGNELLNALDCVIIDVKNESIKPFFVHFKQKIDTDCNEHTLQTYDKSHMLYSLIPGDYSCTDLSHPEPLKNVIFQKDLVAAQSTLLRKSASSCTHDILSMNTHKLFLAKECINICKCKMDITKYYSNVALNLIISVDLSNPKKLNDEHKISLLFPRDKGKKYTWENFELNLIEKNNNPVIELNYQSSK